MRVDEELKEGQPCFHLFREGEGAIGEGVGRDLLRTASEHELGLVVEDADFLNFGIVGFDEELEGIGAAVRLEEVHLIGEPVHFQETVEEVDLEAGEP